MNKFRWLTTLVTVASISAIAGCGDRQIDYDSLDGIGADNIGYDTIGDGIGPDGSIDDTVDLDIRGTDLNGMDLVGVDLVGIDLVGFDLGDFDIGGHDDAVDDTDDIDDQDLVGVDINGMDLNGMDLNGLDIDMPDADDPDAVDLDTNGTDTNGTDTNVEPTECGNPPIPAPASGNCSFTDGNNYLLLRGDVFGPENILRNAMVLIDPTGFIVCADCDCSGTTGYAGATVIACPDALITPGLINAHDHIGYGGNTPKPHTVKYDHRHEWRTGNVSGKPKISVPQTSGAEPWTELRHVVAGATSMFGSGYAQGLLRNLDQELMDISATYKAKYDTFPLDDTSGTMLTSGCSYPGITAWTSVSSFRSYVPHISEGINAAANNEFKCLSSTDGGGQDLVRENSGIIHGIGLTAADIATMAVDGTGLIWSVRTNIDLYGNTAQILLYDRLGVEIGIGPDWTASGSMNMMRELNCVDNLNRNYYNGYFSDRRIIEMATGGSSRVFNIDDKIGALKPGLLADIAIFSTAVHPDERAIIDGNPGDVILTMRSGIPLYGDAALVDGLLPGDTGCESLNVCETAKKVCAKRETGSTLAALQAAGGYDLFFCGVPTGEPSCTPTRPGEYTGILDTDDDGDGEPDTADNCPMVFNPPRPMDNGAQPDADGDGVGDMCDVCPFDANTSECTGFNADDVDGDGFPNADDNCPRDANENQHDDDLDGKGNVCDQCPNDYNPGAAACPATVWDIKNHVVTVGSQVAVSNLIVTGVAMSGIKMTGFFAQEDPAGAEYQGVDFSGIYVYSPGLTPIPEVGRVVSLTGTVSEFYGQLQMTDVSGVVIGAATLVPAPELVTPAEIATGGTRATALEGVLVEVQDVTVTDIAPAIGGGDKTPTNEFVVDGGVRVNDFMYLVTPFPVVDDMFESIVGVLRLANDHSKIEPRSADDVVAVTPELALQAVTPTQSWFGWGETGLKAVPVISVMMNRNVQDGETADVTITTSVTNLTANPSTVNVPVGSRMADIVFDSQTPDLNLLDVDVCAQFGGVEKCTVVTLVPPSWASYMISTEPASPVTLALGERKTIRVNMDVPVFDAGTTIDIAPDDTAVVGAPEWVAFARGDSYVTFEIEGLAAGSSDIGLTYGESTLTVAVTVTEAPVQANVLIAEVFYDHSSGDSGFEWIKLYNAGTVDQDLTGWTLAMGGNSWDVDVDPQSGHYALSGTIAAGGCLVVGGPTADAENGNPTYGLVNDFNPDLQNSGTNADGIALFDIAGAAITATSAPVDAVLYGTTNTNGLIGPDGNVAPVNVGDADAGKTIARTGLTTWEIRSTPTPNLCPPW